MVSYHLFSENYRKLTIALVYPEPEYLKSVMKRYLDTSGGSFAIQTTIPIASAADPSKSAKILIDETLNSTIARLKESFGNVTSMQSISTVTSGLPGYEITYLIANNQSDI
jgi:hypothetical protein